MSRRILVVVLIMFAMTFASVIVSAKPDFNGSWLLNKDRSIGIQPGMEMNITIKRDGDKLEVVTKIKTAQGERVINDIFVLDEKEMDFTPQQPNSKGKRTAKWLPRGNGIMVTDHITTETDKGTVKSQVVRKWVISPDGKELITDMYIDDQRGELVPIRRVFAKNTLN